MFYSTQFSVVKKRWPFYTRIANVTKKGTILKSLINKSPQPLTLLVKISMCGIMNGGIIEHCKESSWWSKEQNILERRKDTEVCTTSQ